MIVSIKDQKREFNSHIDALTALCPGKNKAELLKEFLESFDIVSTEEENYFYAFTLAFESFLYFTYHVEQENFKYFDLDRFYF